MKINLNEINGYRGFLLGALKTGVYQFPKSGDFVAMVQ